LESLRENKDKTRMLMLNVGMSSWKLRWAQQSWVGLRMLKVGQKSQQNSVALVVTLLGRCKQRKTYSI